MLPLKDHKEFFSVEGTSKLKQTHILEREHKPSALQLCAPERSAAGPLARSPPLWEPNKLDFLNCLSNLSNLNNFNNLNRHETLKEVP